MKSTIKFILLLTFGLYFIVATAHTFWFFAEAKYQCVKQEGLSHGLLVGCGKFNFSPAGRLLNDGFIVNIVKGWAWPFHYLNENESAKKPSDKFIEQGRKDAEELINHLNADFARTGGDDLAVDFEASLIKEKEILLSYMVTENFWREAEKYSKPQLISLFDTMLCSSSQNTSDQELISKLFELGYTITYRLYPPNNADKIENTIVKC